MEQRQISDDEMNAALQNPQWTSSGKTVPGRGPRLHYWARIHGRLLRVTVAVEDDEVVSVVAPEEEK